MGRVQARRSSLDLIAKAKKRTTMWLPAARSSTAPRPRPSVFAVFPLMLLVMMTILMVQPQSFQRLFLVLATAPLWRRYLR
jgi:multidrug efflux pump subunit AcrB